MRRLKAVFGGSGGKGRLQGIVSLPGVQVVESHEELYRTVRQLGSGITATVHEGVGRDGFRYALKLFSHASLRGDDEAVDLFRTEVEVLRKSGMHRFVVSLHDVISTPSAALLVMELVSGGDLMSPIERQDGKPYDEHRAQHIFAQMALAVRRLHLAWHRDPSLASDPQHPSPNPDPGPRAQPMALRLSLRLRSALGAPPALARHRAPRPQAGERLLHDGRAAVDQADRPRCRRRAAGRRRRRAE